MSQDRYVPFLSQHLQRPHMIEMGMGEHYSIGLTVSPKQLCSQLFNLWVGGLKSGIDQHPTSIGRYNIHVHENVLDPPYTGGNTKDIPEDFEFFRLLFNKLWVGHGRNM